MNREAHDPLVAPARLAGEAGQFPKSPALFDTQLEAQIELTWQALISAATADLQRSAWQRMKAQIAMRSPAQIERMERERGLRVS